MFFNDETASPGGIIQLLAFLKNEKSESGDEKSEDNNC